MTRAVKIPDATHPITIRPTGSHVTVRVGGVTVAESDNALSLAEASYPVVQYIPIGDVDQSLLERTDTQTYCPYKGEASYYSVRKPDGRPRRTSSGRTSSRTRRSVRSRDAWRSTRTARRSPSHSGSRYRRCRHAARARAEGGRRSPAGDRDAQLLEEGLGFGAHRAAQAGDGRERER